MSDTTWDECKCCRHDTDCIDGLCIECFEYGNKPITEHPDVQRLIGQVVELQAENAKLKDAIQAIIDHEEARKKCGCGYDLFVHDTAVVAIVF